MHLRKLFWPPIVKSLKSNFSSFFMSVRIYNACKFPGLFSFLLQYHYLRISAVLHCLLSFVKVLWVHRHAGHAGCVGLCRSFDLQGTQKVIYNRMNSSVIFVKWQNKFFLIILLNT